MLGHCNDEKTYYWVRNEMPIKNTLDVAKRFFIYEKLATGVCRVMIKTVALIPFGNYQKVDFLSLLA